MFMRWWMGNSYKALVIAFLSFSLVLSGCSLLPNEREEEVLPDIIPPQISQRPEYTVTTDTLETTVSIMGKLISLEEESLFFDLADRYIKDVYVKNGEYVEEGQLIAELDVSELEKSLRLERINFQRDELAMKELLRTRDDMEQSEFEERRIAFEEKRQKLLDMEEEISKAQLVAPFSGTIVSLTMQKGDLSKAYQTVAIVADTNLLVPAAKLTKNDQDKIAVGMNAVIAISNGGTYEGTVKQLPNKSTDTGNPDPNSNIERVEDFMIIDVKEKLAEGLQRGNPANISVIIKRTENAIVIPPSALRSIGNRTYVQIVEEDGKREVDVEVGQQTATKVEILQGLTVGQKVVGR